MYSASDLKKGLKIEIDGAPYAITDFSFHKPGKGQAVYTCKVRNMLNGSAMTKTYRPNDRIEKPMLEEKKLHYSYPDGDNFVFMDEDYEQIFISAELMDNGRFFLAENTAVEILFYNGQAIEVRLPNFIEKEIMHTDPGARGNTATNVLKPATLDSGYEIQVPLFMNKGDIIKIDTRTGKYVDRVRKK